MDDGSCCGGGSCAPDRREFLGGALAAGSAFASLRLPVRQQGDHCVPADKRLDAAWLAALTERAAPRPWTGDELRTVAMPCGGIASGQLYVDGQGKLAQWWIANDACHSSYGGQERIQTPTGEQGCCYGTFAPPRLVQQGVLLTTVRGSETRVTDLQAKSFLGEYPVATLQMTGDDGEPALQVTQEVFSPFVPLQAERSALPAVLLRFTLTNPGKVPVAAVLTPYLENPLLLAHRQELPAQVRGTVVRQPGLVAVTMDAVGTATATAPLRVLADFEHGYGDWQAEGEALGTAPAKGTLPQQNRVSGFGGEHLVNTYRGGDDSTGSLTSPAFAIDAPYLCFRIGGGRDEQKLCLQLLVDGKVVRSATGRRSEHLRLQVWDLRDLRGRQGVLRILDRQQGPWGHVNVDDIALCDEPPAELQFTQQHPQAGEVALVALDNTAQALVAAPSLAALRAQLQQHAFTGAQAGKVPLGQAQLNAVQSRAVVPAGESRTLTFAVTWFFPNRHQREDEGAAPGEMVGADGPWVGNRYAAGHRSAVDVAATLAEAGEALRQQTFAFRDALYRDTTLPHWLVQRLAAPLSTLATATVQWWADGRFWAWEGVGCCSGTCGHVWNYAQGLARLFPELERAVRREQDFHPARGLKADGAIGFRGTPTYPWAGDAQAGYVLKAWREHLCSADQSFLRAVWPQVRQALGFLIGQDRGDGAEADGLLEGRQHNTYDIDFYGGNTMVGSLYLAALQAAARMARLVGEADFADRCAALAARGAEVTMQRLWNREYFVQQVDLKAHSKHQYGDGCLADQLLGEWFGGQLGLDPVYPRAAIRTALQSIWKYNWAPDCGPQMQAHKPDRYFARDGEPGLFVCTWPRSRHLGPESVLYRDEVWTGIEYQVAAHMLREGLVSEGLSIVRGIHVRYDGRKHNPYNEVECGDHYARALASWSCLLAVSGFQYDGPAGVLRFAPVLTPADFRCVFTAAAGWGSYAQSQAGDRQTHTLQLRGGHLRLAELQVQLPAGRRAGTVEMRLGDAAIAVEARAEAGALRLVLASPVVVAADGPALTVTVPLAGG